MMIELTERERPMGLGTAREHRRQRRIPFEEIGVVELRRKRRSRVPAITTMNIRSISRDGIGFDVDVTHSLRLRRGDAVLLYFCAGNLPVEIPARIAWTRRLDDHRARVGVRLLLGETVTASRAAYGKWVAAAAHDCCEPSLWRP